MPNFRRSQNILILYGSFTASVAILVLINLFLSPSESESAVALGLSAPRLLMAIALFAALILFSLLSIKAFRQPIWAERFLEHWFGGGIVSQRLLWFSSISLTLSWIGQFLPVYRVETFANYWVRIQPFISFLLLASLATIFVFLAARIKSWNWAALNLGLFLFVFSLLILGLMLYSGFGIVSSEDFWYGPGVPILAGQLGLTIVVGIAFLYFGTHRMSNRADIWLCVLIYTLTAFIWMYAPLQKSFLMTGPYLPNRSFYPFSDAAAFDTASQFPLIGQNFLFYNNLFFERPVYLSFLTYLHALFGQDYSLLMAVQAGILAILPVLIYLIGRSLNMRVIGLTAALVTMFRGLNGIMASNIIDTAGPKMMLTDFPTAIGLTLIILLTCEWLKAPERRLNKAIWVGGAIGFTLMLRTNALLFLAFIPFYAMFVFTVKYWRQWIFSFMLILLGAIAITLPWEVRNFSLGEQMYQPIITKFQAVIQQRYPTPQPTPSSFTPYDQKLAMVLLKDTQVVIALQHNQLDSENTIPCNSVICFSANHFLHNIATSILVLPTSPMLNDLRHLFRERSPYWQVDWDGSFSGSALLLLCLSLFFISTGITLAWRRQRFIGLVPLAVFLIYNLSNALARTSGGRYLVPLDWILLIYYLLGIFHIITWLANDLEIPWNIFTTPAELDLSTRENFYTKSLGAFTALLLFGSLLPLSEHLLPPRYQNQDPLTTLNNSSVQLTEAGITQTALHEFLHNPKAKVLLGRALYPRYYKMGQGNYANGFYPYQILDFPRIAFRLIGPAGDYGVILPIHDVPEYFPHTGDMLVVGCNGQNYLDALLVIALDNHNILYTRKPAAATLQCPLPQPVCNNNSVCQ